MCSQREFTEDCTALQRESVSQHYFRPTKRTRSVVARPWPPANAPKQPVRTTLLHTGASMLFTTESGFCRPRIFTPSTRTAHKDPRNSNFLSNPRFTLAYAGKREELGGPTSCC